MTLNSTIFWLASATCLVAQIAILRSVLRTSPSKLRTGSRPRHHAVVEIAWVVLPALALASVLAITWRTIHPPEPTHGHVHANVVRSGD